MMVIWLYFNHILNNFVVIHFLLLFFFTYTFMIVLIKFLVSMEDNVILEGHTVEEEHAGETIPTVPTSALGNNDIAPMGLQKLELPPKQS
jgi:hypothetical protein